MKVRDIMTKRVITVAEDESVSDVIKKLAKNDISTLPVINKSKKLVGIVTEADVIGAIDIYSPKIRLETESSFSIVLAMLKNPDILNIKKGALEKIKVKEFMNTKPIVIYENENVLYAARLINKYKIKALPVLNKNEKLVGIIARADIVKMLAK